VAYPHSNLLPSLDLNDQCHPTGLGKTLQSLSFLLHLLNSDSLKYPTKPTTDPKFLIVVPLSVLDNWVTEIRKFSVEGVVRVVKYMGTKEEREELRERLVDGDLEFEILLTTYEYATSVSPSFLYVVHFRK
jgi:SNF2 family DNA or RNA helicase